MTPKEFDDLSAVNREINKIPYDALPGLGEPYNYWHDTPEPGRSFVCRDYVQAKAQRLREAGWDPLRLRTVLCYVEPPNPEYHAVLGVQDGTDIWVLDSRADDPYRLEKPSPNLYSWDRIQVPGIDQFVPIV